MADVTVIGAGAAGFFAALAARGAIADDGTIGPADPAAPSVVLVDGQETPGRKILIAGGGRCNVTNAQVRPDDFWTGQPRLLRNALRAFGTDEAQRAFASIGIHLKQEPLGKLFPESNRARDVLDALLGATRRLGVEHRFGTPAERVERQTHGWSVDGEATQRIILATGGRSVPATGSTGFGLDLAEALGHRVHPSVPALAPLHGTAREDLAGLTLPAILTVHGDRGPITHAAGSMLFTHKGVTGPTALDVSGEVERLLATGVAPRVTADLWSLADPRGPFAEHLGAPKLPGCSLAQAPSPISPADLDAELADAASAHPQRTLEVHLATRLPRRLATSAAGVQATTPIGQLRRDDRRSLAHRLAQWDLAVTGTGGYAKAEVTLGGVDLGELDRTTLESRLAPGLHLCGEVCDVTGRLGGFNFQWAWTSGWLAGRGAASGIAKNDD